jgi:hypothetical protein
MRDKEATRALLVTFGEESGETSLSLRTLNPVPLTEAQRDGESGE